jgi:hypothetical protein
VYSVPSLKEGHIDKSKLASHAFEEDHGIDWMNTTILQSELNAIYRKSKEARHTVCTNNPISQCSLGIFPVWYPLIDMELHR